MLMTAVMADDSTFKVGDRVLYKDPEVQLICVITDDTSDDHFIGYQFRVVEVVKQAHPGTEPYQPGQGLGRARLRRADRTGNSSSTWSIQPAA